MKLIKESQIRDIVRKKGLRIGKRAIDRISNELEKKIDAIIEKSERNAKISGRKTIREEDID